MSDVALTSIVSRIKRFISDTVVSGTYTDSELELYAQDATLIIPIDYPDFTSYTVVVASGISPTPTNTHSILISLKAASMAYDATIQESISDAIMVKAGAIALDTSKSLSAKGLQGSKLQAQYEKMINSLIMDLSGANAIGYRIDNFITVESEQHDEDADSLITW